MIWFEEIIHAFDIFECVRGEGKRLEEVTPKKLVITRDDNAITDLRSVRGFKTEYSML